MPPIDQSVVRNRLLAALPAGEFAKIRPKLRQVVLQNRAVLHAPDTVIAAAHFPEIGYVSQIATFEDGEGIEVGMTGPEGMVGLPLLYGADMSSIESLVQAGGLAFQVEAADFARALDELPAFKALLLRYAFAFSCQVAMTAACNGRHLVEQRLARWLLMAHDRVEGDSFMMTHDLLSRMLGVRRAGISVAANALQRAGLIQYERGRMQIRDRAGLEAIACECHAMVAKQFARLLGVRGVG